MRFAIAILFFGIGFLLGQETIITGYDPVNLERMGRILAANTYILGCVNAGKTNVECQAEADLWYRGGDPKRTKTCDKKRCPYPR